MKHRRYLLLIALILVAIFILTQLQPWIVERAGGVAGSFGVRPVTHLCLGITDENVHLSPGELDFTFLYFHFRYSVPSDPPRPLCIGQDIWYGE